jgi:hypothetical protein
LFAGRLLNIIPIILGLLIYTSLTEKYLGSIKMIKEGLTFQFFTGIFIILIFSVLLWMAMQGKKLPKLRRLPMVDAVRNIIGRCVEMGRPLMFNIAPRTGQSGVPESLVGYTVLGYVSRLAVKMDCRLIGTTTEPPALAIMQNIVRDSYMAEGKLDKYRSEDWQYFTSDFWGYGTAVWDVMFKENIGGHIYLNPSGAQTLTLLETANRIGAMQLSGTAFTFRIPDTVVGADYFMVGEEIFSAAAYLSEDPVQTGAILAQDVMRFFGIALILIGAILYAAGFKDVVKIFTM